MGATSISASQGLNKRIGGREHWPRTTTRPRSPSLVHHPLLIATIVVASFTSSCRCSPVERNPTKSDDSFLSNIIDEFDDGLKRLKEYSNVHHHQKESTSDSATEEEPLPENLEKKHYEDIPYPEIVPGLDRFEKELDDDFSDPESSNSDEIIIAPTTKTRGQSDNVNDISLQEIVDFVRESIVQKRKDSSQHVSVSRVTTRAIDEVKTLSPLHQKESPTKKNLVTKQQLPSFDDSRKDISLKDLLDFLRERKNQQTKKDGGSSSSSSSSLSSQEESNAAAEDVMKKEIELKRNKNLNDAVNENDDVSLKDALEFLSTLKKQMNENKSQQMSPK